jgi:hypothetical protein
MTHVHSGGQAVVGMVESPGGGSPLKSDIGQVAMPSLPACYVALFTTLPSSNAGTGGTEVSGGSYARVQIAGAATTNATTASGNATQHFASTPSWIVAGMTMRDATSSSVIPANMTVLTSAIQHNRVTVPVGDSKRHGVAAKTACGINEAEIRKPVAMLSLCRRLPRKL